ncbi:MAG TPA: DUF6599 family protein [Acidobacteriaceae bacterium]
MSRQRGFLARSGAVRARRVSGCRMAAMVVCLVLASGAQARTGAGGDKAAPALLPPSAGGLRLAAPAGTFAGAAGPGAGLDAAHGPLLREDGLIDGAEGRYLGAGGGLSVRAYRFADATGAFAAFTAYREPGMRVETLGTEGASRGGKYLFWTGATLVEATAAQPDGQVLEALRTLAAALPAALGTAAVAPPLPGYLPTDGLDRASVHYAIGPAGYAASGAALPESVIDFSRDAEVVVAHYRRHGADGTLMLVAYPTPQMAARSTKAVAALLKSGTPGLPVGDPGVVAEQIGPLVGLTGGHLSQAEAQNLLGEVHYQAAITINHPEGYVSEVSKAAKLLLGIASLTGVLAVAAVLLALFLGGGRVLLRRMRGKPDSSMNDDDFISLKLG